MTDPQSHDDLATIAARYAAVAKDIVSQTAQVATDAFDKINTSTAGTSYQATDAIASIARLARIAISGGISIGRVALQVKPDPRVLLVADNVADSMTSAIGDVIGVARDAATKASNREFCRDDLVDSGIRLTSIAALRGAEVVQTVVAGPGQYGATSAVAEFDIGAANAKAANTALAAPNDAQLQLILTKLVRTNDNIDVKHRAVIDPVVLPDAETTTFRIAITNIVGLPSGNYEGIVVLKLGGQKVGEDINITIAVPRPPDETQPNSP